ncbi:hypothetical protein R3W88_016763 [Solanum pinnatisectum]|uniref:Methyltransferase n=1 Tax=Solanum pinnatisectum TaxID=50273 RepID=A0AAV9L0L6_9SOLN|nr:hypothetical protein R3W88_016763 [Solanum pinnatisectum]
MSILCRGPGPCTCEEIIKTSWSIKTYHAPFDLLSHLVLSYNSNSLSIEITLCQFDICRYTKIETFLTPLPEVAIEEEVAGGQLEKWPKRLHTIPPRISRGTVDSITEDVFQKDSHLWKRRNINFFSIGAMLCQLTQEYIISFMQISCEMEDIMLELDRILRPKRSVIIRDDLKFVLSLVLLSILITVLLQSQVIESQGEQQTCLASNGNLNICSPFVLPGTSNTTPSTDACATRLPSHCNLSPVSCARHH